MRATLLDTNVVSELIRDEADPHVAAFVAGLEGPLLSVAVLHELIYGMTMLPFGTKKRRLAAGIATIASRFQNYLVATDAEVSRVAGELRAQAQKRGAELKPMDAHIAAAALTRDARLATKNVRHFQELGIEIVDPWRP